MFEGARDGWIMVCCFLNSNCIVIKRDIEESQYFVRRQFSTVFAVMFLAQYSTYQRKHLVTVFSLMSRSI